MSYWLKAANFFEENSKDGSYFGTQSGVYALKRIQTFLETTSPQMFFLLGEPGSGKSFTLHHLYRLYAPKRLSILIENPFLTPEQLLQRLLISKGIKEEFEELESLEIRVIEAYKEADHLIMIDEGQLLSPKMWEFIRTLSDSGIFYFLIAMHKDEGEEILSSPHFHSRPHQIVYLQDLKLNECVKYLEKELQTIEEINVKKLFNEIFIKKSWEYSKGNFRNFKKCYYHLFLLLDYAHTHNKKEFLKPNLRLLKMAAIRSKLLASQENSYDFDKLLKESKKNKTLFLSLGLGIFLLVSAVLLWWINGKTVEFKNIKDLAKKQEKNDTLVEEVVLNLPKNIEDIENQNLNRNEKKSKAKSSINMITIPDTKDTSSLAESESTIDNKQKKSTSKETLILKTSHLPAPKDGVKRIYIRPYPKLDSSAK